jgi:predicted acyl esterase
VVQDPSNTQKTARKDAPKQRPNEKDSKNARQRLDGASSDGNRARATNKIQKTLFIIMGYYDGKGASAEKVL